MNALHIPLNFTDNEFLSELTQKINFDFDIDKRINDISVLLDELIGNDIAIGEAEELEVELANVEFNYERLSNTMKKHLPKLIESLGRESTLASELLDDLIEIEFDY